MRDLIEELEAAGANLIAGPSLDLGVRRYSLPLSEADEHLPILVRHASPEVRRQVLRDLLEERVKGLARNEWTAFQVDIAAADEPLRQILLDFLAPVATPEEGGQGDS